MDERPVPPVVAPAVPLEVEEKRASRASGFSFISSTLQNLRQSISKVGDDVMVDDGQLEGLAARSASVKNWTKEQQLQLESGLMANTEELTPEVWDRIAEGVADKSGVECMDRFVYLQRALAKKPVPESNPSRPPPPGAAPTHTAAASGNILGRASGIISSFIGVTRGKPTDEPKSQYVGRLQADAKEFANSWFTPEECEVVSVKATDPLTVAWEAVSRASKNTSVLVFDGATFTGELSVVSLIFYYVTHVLPGHGSLENTHCGSVVHSYPVKTIPKLDTIKVGDVLSVWSSNPNLPHVFITPSEDEEIRFRSKLLRSKVLAFALSRLPPDVLSKKVELEEHKTAFFSSELLVSVLRAMAASKENAVAILADKSLEFLGAMSWDLLESVGLEKLQSQLFAPVGALLTDRTFARAGTEDNTVAKIGEVFAQYPQAAVVWFGTNAPLKTVSFHRLYETLFIK